MSITMNIPSDKVSVSIPQGICSSCSSPSPQSSYFVLEVISIGTSTYYHQTLQMNLPLCKTCNTYHQILDDYKKYARKNDPSFVENSGYLEMIKIIKPIWVVAGIIAIYLYASNSFIPYGSPAYGLPINYMMACIIPLILIIIPWILWGWLNKRVGSYDKNMEQKLVAEAKEKFKWVTIKGHGGVSSGSFVVSFQNEDYGRLFQAANN